MQADILVQTNWTSTWSCGEGKDAHWLLMASRGCAWAAIFFNIVKLLIVCPQLFPKIFSLVLYCFKFIAALPNTQDTSLLLNITLLYLIKVNTVDLPSGITSCWSMARFKLEAADLWHTSVVLSSGAWEDFIWYEHPLVWCSVQFYGHSHYISSKRL